MRAKRASFHTKAHCDGGRVPSRCCQALENCFSSSFVVQMEWLRIELGSEPLDIIFRDLDCLTLETHPQRQIFEPFDHHPFAFLTARPSCLNNCLFERRFVSSKKRKKTGGGFPPGFVFWCRAAQPGRS